MITKESKPMSVYIDVEKLKQVETFTYLRESSQKNQFAHQKKDWPSF